MKRRSRDEEREQRITMEIIVDAYTPEEQAMGWYYSLEDRLTGRRRRDGPRGGVRTRDVRPDPLGTPSPCGSLGQLEGVTVDKQTHQAIEDWQYWIAQGYEL
jgi:Calcium binding